MLYRGRRLVDRSRQSTMITGSSKSAGRLVMLNERGEPPGRIRGAMYQGRFLPDFSQVIRFFEF
jgi:hypothetical protein